jgi:hypothetical protein
LRLKEWECGLDVKIDDDDEIYSFYAKIVKMLQVFFNIESLFSYRSLSSVYVL